MNKIIYITGFMGSGKSTIGPILANTIGWEFYDLDQVIEDETGMKVSAIFEKHGEEYFRDLERKTLSRLASNEKAIISLGGGTVTSQENIKLIKKTGKLIYLKVSPESAYLRLRFKRDRPVLTRDGTVNLGKEEFINKLNRLIESRKKYYEQADITIDTDDTAIGKTVDKIARIIQYEM